MLQSPDETKAGPSRPNSISQNRHARDQSGGHERFGNYTEREEEAAIVIQKHYRGHQARQKTPKVHL
jgi:hypothetical protein